MKGLLSFALVLLAIAVLIGPAAAQGPLTAIVYGQVLNPDLSKPDSADIKYRAYLTNDPLDTLVGRSQNEGMWSLALALFAGGSFPWQAGDTLAMRFENVGNGPFKGAVTYLRYVTTNEDLQYAGQSALPVELVEFVAAVEQTELATRVRLTWKTASESNNFGFEVQRSPDRSNFQTLAFIPGAGTTAARQAYEYVDQEVRVGTYYYRLKQVDRDGSIQFTEPQCVEVAAPRAYALRQNYPNPFNPSTEIVYQLKEGGRVSLVVYNVLGEQVASLVDQVQEAGIHRVTFDASGLPTGVFFYRLRVNGFDQMRKMAVLK
ncbi:MAG: T9SS type A sorting domain-containing protein [bacterium]|jgi:hypothetical protein|nr:T9SS type A sorting domain-containing protein [candidate division KSB1 bacterium]MDH7559686.1 T9SS type A sorting domain-containing protein [bacterium]